MAGKFRPQVIGLGAEAKYKVLDFKTSYSNTNPCGLFDGQAGTWWNNPNMFSWGTDKSYYLEIEIYSDCNIWRSGISSYEGEYARLIIEKWNEETSSYQTISVTQTLSSIGNNAWQKWCENLEAGRYKFTCNGQYISGKLKGRADGEWYLESTAVYLIQKDNKVYTIENDTLVEITDTISKDVIRDRGVGLATINANMNLINGKFKLLSHGNVDVDVNNIKTNDELVVMNNDFYTHSQSNIDFIKHDFSLIGNGNIKMAFSIDEGVTWKIYSSPEFIDLPITIPNKPYNELTEEELIQWNNARDVILSKGIYPSSLKDIDFNKLEFDKIRFAYVLHIDDITDSALNKQTSWQFDAKDSMLLMKDDEIDIEILSTGIKVTPKIDTEMIKVNILT